MKRTTHIMIGLWIAGFGVILFIATGFFLVDERESDNIHWRVEGPRITKELPSFQTFRLSYISKNGAFNLEDTFLDVLPAQNGKNEISFPEEIGEYFVTELKGDTLVATLEIPKELKEKMLKYAYLSLGNWQLNISSDVQCLINEMSGQEMRIRNLSCDSLNISSSTYVTVDSCCFNALHVQYSYQQLKLLSGNIGHLYINMDYVDNWIIDPEHCRIYAEHLTGSGGHVRLGKGECERLYWNPSSGKAVLNVSLSGKSCILVKDSL